jgi:hypothetical protein
VSDIADIIGLAVANDREVRIIFGSAISLHRPFASVPIVASAHPWLQISS